jgi:hypothetical protein
MSNVSTVTPASLINTARTASGFAASSTASPNNSSTITTWQLPGFPSQPLVNSTQSFSTTQGQVFTDFASGQIVETGGAQSGQQTYSLQAGNPANND